MSTAKRSAGIVVVRRRPRDEVRFLLLRAYRNWDFPKGRIEPGESAWDAAVRELQEETGLVLPRKLWGEECVETAPYAGGKIACYFLAEVPDGEVYLPISAELGRPEHDEFRWVDAGEARQLLPSRLQPILDWAIQKLAKAGRSR